MTDSEAWTIGRLLAWTTGFLKEKESASPRLDAEILLAVARGCERIELYTAFGEEPPKDVLARFRELVRRRADGEPVAYLVGQREFYSLTFKVTRDVLIPRPETEFIIVALLDAVKESAQESTPIRIADVGTGSGILAVCAAKNIGSSEVTAIDISPAALEVARTNIEEHGVAKQVQLVESNLFEAVPETSFDFVISNPPYVSSDEMAELPAEVVDYEPHLALYGGDTGTEIIAKLIAASADRLEPGGALIMEISPMIEIAVRDLIMSHPSFAAASTIKDLAGHARVMTAKRSASS